MTGNVRAKCTTCGKLGDLDGRLSQCANCWEVEKRLTDYLKSPAACRFVIVELAARLSITTERSLTKMRGDLSENGTDHEGGIVVDRMAIAIVDAALDQI